LEQAQPAAKKVQGRQQRAPQKQLSFFGLFNFFGRMQPAYSRKIIYKAVNKRHSIRQEQNLAVQQKQLQGTTK